MRRGAASRRRVVAAHTTVGAIVGVLLLHPVTMAIYWFEFHPEGTLGLAFWRFAALRVAHAFEPHMLAMTSAFAVIGALLGSTSGLYYRALLSSRRLVGFLEDELRRDLPSLIGAAEGETVERKESLRWDVREGKVNKALEAVVLKTIAGFLNHRGGSLLIGVEDTGKVAGLDRDYQTLRRKDRDGFEQHFMSLVKTQLGGDVCSLVHVVFNRVDAKDICRILVEPSARPIYLDDAGTARYFVRAGNTTRELDARETVDHLARRSQIH